MSRVCHVYVTWYINRHTCVYVCMYVYNLSREVMGPVRLDSRATRRINKNVTKREWGYRPVDSFLVNRVTVNRVTVTVETPPP